jgi:hypothetical protein
MEAAQKRAAHESDASHRHRVDLGIEARRIADAIAAVGHSPTLISRLVDVEKQIKEIDDNKTLRKATSFKVQAEEVRRYVMSSLLQTSEILRDGLQPAKMAMARHVGELKMTPVETERGKAYQVTGDWQLMPDQKSVVQVVARDGFEPPTPAFSGLRSTN